MDSRFSPRPASLGPACTGGGGATKASRPTGAGVGSSRRGGGAPISARAPGSGATATVVDFGAFRGRFLGDLSGLSAASFTTRVRVRVRRDFFLPASVSTRAEADELSSEEGGNMKGTAEV